MEPLEPADDDDDDDDDDEPKSVAWRPIVRKEMYDPEDPTNIESTEATVVSIEAWAEAMLKAMEGCPVSDYLDSCEGKFSEGHATAQTKEDLSRTGDAHLERTNGLVESTFGVVDDYYHSFQTGLQLGSRRSGLQLGCWGGTDANESYNGHCLCQREGLERYRQEGD